MALTIGKPRQGILNQLMGEATPSISLGLQYLLKDKINTMQQQRKQEYETSNKERMFTDLVTGGMEQNLARIVVNASERERSHMFQSPDFAAQMKGSQPSTGQAASPIGTGGQQPLDQQPLGQQLGQQQLDPQQLDQQLADQFGSPQDQGGDIMGLIKPFLAQGGAAPQQEQPAQESPADIFSRLIRTGSEKSPLLRQNAELAEKRFEFDRQQAAEKAAERERVRQGKTLERKEDIKATKALEQKKSLEKIFSSYKPDIDKAYSTRKNAIKKINNYDEILHVLDNTDAYTGLKQTAINALGLNKVITNVATQWGDAATSKAFTNKLDGIASDGGKLIKDVVSSLKKTVPTMSSQKDSIRIITEGEKAIELKDLAIAKAEIKALTKYKNEKEDPPPNWKLEAEKTIKEKLDKYDFDYAKVVGKELYKYAMETDPESKKNVEDGTWRDGDEIVTDNGNKKFLLKDKSLILLKKGK